MVRACGPFSGRISFPSGVYVQRQPSDERLSRISTQWSLIYQAHWGGSNASSAAQCAFVQRYCGAVYRYLLGALRNEDAAEELFQEFALRFVRGDFRRADPDRGRFRDYLKTSLVHLVTDYHRRRSSEPGRLLDDHPGPQLPGPYDDDENETFVASWREELLDQTWKALAESQPNYYRILLWHAEHPEMSSAEVAAKCSAEHDKPMTAGNLRVTLHRAREKFSELLVKEVAHSLEHPQPDEVARELRDLHLLSLCETALQRWQRRENE